MAIEYLESQLQLVDPEQLAILLSAKRLCLQDAGDGSIWRRVDDDIETVPVLHSISDVLTSNFIEKNRQYLNDDDETDDECNYQSRLDMSEQHLQYYSRMFNYGVALSCLAVKALTEPPENLGRSMPSLERPDLVEAALLDINEYQTEDIVEDFCDEVFDQKGGLTAQGFGAYEAFAELPTSIGTAAVEDFRDRGAYAFAQWGATATFAALILVIDFESQTAKERHAADRQIMITKYEEFLDGLPTL